MVAAPLYYVAATSYGFMRTNGSLVVWLMVLLLWTLDDNVADDSAGESLVASGGYIFARMAIATQIMAMQPLIVPYNSMYCLRVGRWN